MYTLLAQVDLDDTLWGNSAAKLGGLTKSPFSLIESVLPNIYIAASIILLIYAVFGGFLILTSAGNKEGTSKGSQIITNALFGFLIIFASYWIIQAIQVITGIPILTGNF